MVIPSLDIWMGNRALMKGVPKITSFLRFFTRRKFVLILRPWFSMIAFDSLKLIFNFEPFAVLSYSKVFSKNFVGINPSKMQFESAPVSNRAIDSKTKSLIIIFMFM